MPPAGSAEASVCDKCGGDGWFSIDVPIGHPQFGKMLPCECQTASRAARLQSICGLNPSERNIRLGQIDTQGRPSTQGMVRAGAAFVDSPALMLTLWGGPGNAKTTVMMGVVNELVGRGVEAVYMTFADLESWVRAAFDERRHDEFGSARTRIAKLADLPVLAIDEFDKVKVTAWLDELRFDLLDKRYRAAICRQSGTLLAMNCNPQTLPDWIASRIYDGRNVVIENTDRDMRPLMKG